jgi:hypothetical protein
MSRPLIIAGWMLALLAFPPTTSPACATHASVQMLPSTISAQSLKYILSQCEVAWPTYTYGNLRSAYNHGTLTIVRTVKPDGIYNDVSFGGVTLCVIENI